MSLNACRKDGGCNWPQLFDRGSTRASDSNEKTEDAVLLELNAKHKK